MFLFRAYRIESNLSKKSDLGYPSQIRYDIVLGIDMEKKLSSIARL